MFNFKKLVDVLQSNKDINYDVEFWHRVSCISELAWANSTEKAVKYGLKSVGLQEIDALFESAWALPTMEDDEDVTSYYSPIMENIAMFELIDILLSLPQSKTPCKLF